MGSPSRSDLGVISPMLSNFAVSYGQARLVTTTGRAFGLTADFFFPVVPHNVEGLEGTFLKLDPGNESQTPTTNRANLADYNSIDWKLTSDTYRLEDHGLGWNWDDNMIKAGVGPVQLNRRGTQIVATNVMTAWDRRVNDVVTASGNYTLSNTATFATLDPGSAQLSTSSADLAAVIDAARERIFLNSGYEGRLRAVMGRDVWFNGVKRNDDIISSLQASNKEGGSSDITPMKVGNDLLEVDLRINSNRVNSAGDVAAGTFTPSLDFGDNIVVFAEPEPGIDATMFGATFQGENFTTRTRDIGDRGHRVTVAHMVVEKLIDQRFAYLITDCLA